MSEVTMIGIDLAKRVFQLHGADTNGTVIFRKKLTRVQLLAFCRLDVNSESQNFGKINPWPLTLIVRA